MVDNFDRTPMSTGNWFITQLVLGIPLVGLIMLFVWGFGTSGYLGRRNFCRAGLIWLLIFVVIGVIGGILSSILGGPNLQQTY